VKIEQIFSSLVYPIVISSLLRVDYPHLIKNHIRWKTKNNKRILYGVVFFHITGFFSPKKHKYQLVYNFVLKLLDRIFYYLKNSVHLLIISHANPKKRII